MNEWKKVLSGEWSLLMWCIYLLLVSGVSNEQLMGGGCVQKQQ